MTEDRYRRIERAVRRAELKQTARLLAAMGAAAGLAYGGRVLVCDVGGLWAPLGWVVAGIAVAVVAWAFRFMPSPAPDVVARELMKEDSAQVEDSST